jgi:hypothetical protein
VSRKVQITLSRRPVVFGNHPSRPTTLLERFKLLLGGVLVAVAVAGVLTLALLLGSFIIGLAGIAVITAVVVAIVRITIARARQ